MGIEELLALSKSGEESDTKDNVLSIIDEAIDTHLWGMNDKEDELYDIDGIEHGFHPSALAGSFCARRLQYEFIKVPQEERMKREINPKLRRVFDNGSYVHKRWQRYFMDMSQAGLGIDLVGSWRCGSCHYLHSPDVEVTMPIGLSCPKCGHDNWKYGEFRLRNKSMRVVGKRDGKLIINGEPYLLEIKSITTFKFKPLVRPEKDHIKQFSFYMFLDGTKKGIILYEDKNDQNYKTFFHKYNSDNIMGELNVLTETNKGIDDETLCDRVDDYPSDRCKLCPYYKTCIEDKAYNELVQKN